MVKALCFFVHVTKGRSTHKQITPQYRELVAKVSGEANEKNKKYDHSKKNSKLLLEELLAIKHETKKPGSPRKNTSFNAYGKHHPYNGSMDKSVDPSKRGVNSLVLNMSANRESMLADLNKSYSPTLKKGAVSENVLAEALARRKERENNDKPLLCSIERQLQEESRILDDKAEKQKVKRRRVKLNVL